MPCSWSTIRYNFETLDFLMRPEGRKELKMTKFWMISMAALFVAGSAEAAPRRQQRAQPAYSAPKSGGQNQAGCGLGSMAIEDNSKWAQVGAAFLNSTGMQTFAISFGTSNCSEDGVASASREKDAFVEANFADIRRDLSVGGGDYLSSLASLYGCKEASQAESFHRALHKHRNEVLGSTPEAASKTIDQAVAAESVSCQS
jgi:hypothetical protein